MKLEQKYCFWQLRLDNHLKHTNELYYCNLLNDESIQKTNNKNLCIDVLVE